MEDTNEVRDAFIFISLEGATSLLGDLILVVSDVSVVGCDAETRTDRVSVSDSQPEIIVKENNNNIIIK
jgi:hypothetical protein